MRRAVEPAAVGLLRGELVKGVRARLDELEVLALGNDRDQDVPDVHGVAARGLHADQVIAEARQHGL